MSNEPREERLALQAFHQAERRLERDKVPERSGSSKYVAQAIEAAYDSGYRQATAEAMRRFSRIHRETSGELDIVDRVRLMSDRVDAYDPNSPLARALQEAITGRRAT